VLGDQLGELLFGDVGAASWARRSPNTFTGRRTFRSMKVMIGNR
jgi:hypothetical protein